MTNSGRQATYDERAVAAYAAGETSFIVGLLPEHAVALSADETLRVLARRLGEQRLDAALSAAACDPERPSPIASPHAARRDGQWLRRSNVVGINVRTTTSLFGALKYTLTLPAAQDAIHLLPIWQPGVVQSLYGPCSWELSGELFDAELAAAVPHLDTPARQLRAFVNVLHACGRAVGMDVIPHTDRYSEMSLAHPEHFEWLRRDDRTIVDHRAELHREVQAELLSLVARLGPALRDEAPPRAVDELFGADVDEPRRLRVLFGRPDDPAGREARRIAMVKHLHALGYEPVPATMGPPYRGIEVDDEAATTDAHGLLWRDYRISAPQAFSRVFGPLARYKLYERLDDNRQWGIDFARPRHATWRYVCEHYAAVQRRFGFDFMRGDMSHVQMRPDGVPAVVDDRYDILRAVKRRIQRDAPWFGYFAESFLAAPGLMAYGDEVEHLEASEADATLGNLQSMTVDSAEFRRELRRYVDIAAARAVAPALTVMTADKDDPRFDAFYRRGNALRLFLALFVGDMPSYMGLGFETRDVHLEPAPNEHYSKLYVFRERSGPKATRGPYRWGNNSALFDALTELRRAADAIVADIGERATRWLLPPDANGGRGLVAFTQRGDDPRYLMLANLDLDAPVVGGAIPLAPCAAAPPALVLALAAQDERGARPTRAAAAAAAALAPDGQRYRLGYLGPGECRVYRLAPA